MNKIKGILYSVALMALVIMAGCSSDRTGDVRGLLQTIPADASMVTVVDVKSMLEKAGCEVDGTKVKPGKELAKVIGESADAKTKEELERLQDGGIDPSVAAIFIEGYNTYLTGYIADTEKFKALVEEGAKEKFQSEGEVEVCGNMAISGERFWGCLNSNNTISVNDVKHFLSLSEKQSILTNEIAAKLEDLEHDMKGWGDIKGCLNTMGLDFTSRASATMALEAMFVDAVEFVWEVDFDKGELEADMTVLNSKGGIAKFNFPAAKIDGSVIKEIGGTADTFIAIAVNPDMVKKLKEETSGKGFSMIGVFAGTLSCVDGTCAFGVSSTGNVNGLISTTGHGTSDLVNGLGQMGLPTSKEDKFLRVSKGEVSGSLSASDAAEALKGSLAGVMYAGNEKPMNLDAINSMSVTFKPEKGGLQAEIKVKGKDEKKNILLALIQSASKMSR